MIKINKNILKKETCGLKKGFNKNTLIFSYNDLSKILQEQMLFQIDDFKEFLEQYDLGWDKETFTISKVTFDRWLKEEK
jgi:hypothetical protein